MPSDRHNAGKLQTGRQAAFGTLGGNASRREDAAFPVVCLLELIRNVEGLLQ